VYLKFCALLEYQQLALSRNMPRENHRYKAAVRTAKILQIRAIRLQ